MCFRFLVLSQSVPVTSYIKMVDVWMLFTMTIPFLEVVYHTSNKISKQKCVMRVTQHNLSEEDEVPNTSRGAVLWKTTKRLLLPLGSFLFTLIFWIVGLIASDYSTGSFRKNGKRKTFFEGIKFHEKLIFSAFFSRELAKNLRS